MGIEPRAPAENARKATVESEDSIRGPPDARRQQPPKEQTPQQNQQPGKMQNPEQTAATAYQAAGPGFTNRVTNSASGLNVSGINPALGQQQNVHQTPGFPGPYPAPGLHGSQSFVAANTNTGARLGFLPHGNTDNHLLIPHQPFHTSQVNQPFLSFPHFPCRTVSTSIPLVLVTMADYGNGFMPNTGQHFQPPVPDTTYGPIQHTYYPRYDSAPRAAGSDIPVTNPAAPCVCPVPVPAPVSVHQPQGVQLVGAAPSPQVIMFQMPCTCPVHASHRQNHADRFLPCFPSTRSVVGRIGRLLFSFLFLIPACLCN